METLVSATELARKLGEYLARVRYRRESFLVERNGKAVARVVPTGDVESITLRRALMVWSSAGPADPAFADDLAKVGSADVAPVNPWGS